MAANILHFGQELDDCFPLLRSAGYSIRLFESFDDFRHALQSGVNHDALSLSELQADFSRMVVQAARSYSRAPLILFRAVGPREFRTDAKSGDGRDSGGCRGWRAFEPGDRVAKEFGITLIGFLREDHFNAYHGAHRLHPRGAMAGTVG